MAKMIEFYTPAKFRPKAQSAANVGKVIEFRIPEKRTA